MMVSFHKKRRFFAVLLCAAFVLTACGNTKTGEDTEMNQSEARTEGMETETVSQSETGKNTETEKESETQKDSETEKETSAGSTSEAPEEDANEGIAFSRKLKLGWNLGNTFDAVDCDWLKDELEYESAWVGTKTTREQIATLKKAGFTSIRIPVSWHNHVAGKGDYTISRKWLERVGEVVDYCLDEGMYVIINIHHDNSKDFLYPTKELEAQSKAYVVAIWQQLSEYFKDYDERLVFEGMNEPRLVGHENEWWIDPDSQDCKDAIACINGFNQAFVDTVRASGGNNATRYLLCPGYAASPDGALNEGFVFPTDPVANDHHIMLTVHAYTPYNFALEEGGTNKWSSKSASDVSNTVGFMNKIADKFVKQGTPVVIDEFGARDKNGNLEARVDFAGFYVNAARTRGMSCFWWDNNLHQGSGELFGVLDRKNCKISKPEIVEAMRKASNGEW